MKKVPVKKGRIDLFIENEDSVIIIENKIKSSINDEKSNDSGKKESQLNKYDQQVSGKIMIKNYIFIFLHQIIIKLI